MKRFERRSWAGIAAAVSIFIVQATGLEAQPRLTDEHDLILRAEPLPPDAQQFIVYRPALNVFLHQKSTGSRPTFLLQYVHWVSGREYFGPSYSLFVNVERQLIPKAALDRCDGAFERANAKNRHRLNGYDCAYVAESENAREATHSRVHFYAKCAYVVILSEQTRLMPMPAQAPVGPLLTALDHAVAALRLGECTDDVTPQAAPSNPPPKPVQSAAPPKPAPAACGADFVARYLAGLANQPPSRRPVPGSIVALIENAKPCVFQMPVAAVAPPPPQRVIVGSQTVDGTTYTFIGLEPVLPLPPSGNYNQFVPAFGPWAATVGRYLEDRMFVHPVLGGNGVPTMATSPYITDGIINAPDATVKLARAGMQAGANWAKNNPGAIAGIGVAMLVTAALPAAPIAAWVLGGGEAAAAAGTLADAVIGGMMYSGTEASVRSMVNDFGSNKSAGQQFMNAVGSGGAAALGSIPASIVGGNVATLFGPFVAQKTASAFGWAAGAAVDKSVDALGFTNAAQTVLSGNVTSPAPQPGGTVLTAAPPSNESLSPQPGFK